ncbi:MAG: hypothetical protein AAB348_01595 [Patescibacteria group bacterium]
MKKLVATFAMALILLPNLAMAAAGDIGTAVDPLGVDKAGGGTGLGNKDIRETVASIIKVALSLLGIVAVVIVLIGGFKWMTAGGNDEQVGEAKKWLYSGIIGLLIILSAYALTKFVIENLIKATT